MKIGIAGSFDSCDALITVIENDKLEIEIESMLKISLKMKSKKLLEQLYKALDLDKVKVICKDKGALNYTIRARLLSAIARIVMIMRRSLLFIPASKPAMLQNAEIFGAE